MLLFNKIFVRFCALALTLTISACGFTPVYKATWDDSQMSDKLASIEIEKADNLLEQVFVSRLQDLLNPTSISSPAKYLIKSDIETQKISLVIQQDRTTTRYKMVATLKYSITDIATGKIVNESSIKREGEYDKVDSDYATYISEEDTKKRIVKELAQDAKVRIMSFMLER